MDAQTTLALLDEHWNTLRTELGSAWEGFERVYLGVAESLPPSPSAEDLERAVDVLLADLTKHAYVRGFVAGFLLAIRRHELPLPRLLLDSASTLEDRRVVELVVNRLRARAEEIRSTESPSNERTGRDDGRNS